MGTALQILFTFRLRFAGGVSSVWKSSNSYKCTTEEKRAAGNKIQVWRRARIPDLSGRETAAPPDRGRELGHGAVAHFTKHARCA
jgi:hypothetical protein